jgi:TDG/mug DNA glycosylase family protein
MVNKFDSLVDDVPVKYGIAPIVSKNCRILLLGSMPSESSLSKQEYYGHPQNSFWSIMQTFTHVASKSPYPERVQSLHNAGIGVWDVIASCVRPGSLDSRISAASISVNPLIELILHHPELQLIGLNGGKAFELFQRHFIKTNLLPSAIKYAKLPSTSPAHTMLKQEKVVLWQQHLLPFVGT